MQYLIRNSFVCLYCSMLAMLVGFSGGGLFCSNAAAADANASSSKSGARSTAAKGAKSLSRKEIMGFSDRIDELVVEQLEEKSIKRSPLASDEVFLRRIYLDVVGRIPTLDETQAFLASRSKNKRAALIDELLDSYGFVSHQFNYWADVLRVRSKTNKVAGQPYIDFIKDSLENNQPYDEFVFDLLASEGKMLSGGPNGVGYYLRDLNMPEDNMSNTVRVFLGTRLECAQCHDHPYDKWTQRDYFEMVAFTGGIGYGGGNSMRNMSKDDRNKIQELRQRSPKAYTQVRRLIGASQIGIFGSGTGLARLPEGFLGDNGEENEIVTAKTMFEKKSLVDVTIPSQSRKQKNRKKKPKRAQKHITGAKEAGTREAYARWMTSSDNPRFAKTIANRLWKQAFGIGLIEPVDIIEDNTTASNEALMEYLTTVMVDLGFDRKQFLRAIFNSRTYQSVATADDIENPREHRFNGPIVRRMSAEQIWDSLLALTVPDTDQRKDAPTQPKYKLDNELAESISMGDPDALDKLISYVDQTANKKKGSSKADKMKKVNRQYSQKMRGTLKQVGQKIRLAQRQGDDQRVQQLLLERSETIQAMKLERSNSPYRRASELASPAPPSHFLRQFGQSDREQIENSNRDPAVPQILSMMNGMIEKQIVKDPNTVLMSNLLKSRSGNQTSKGGGYLSDPSTAISTLFLTMLNRNPTRLEAKQWKDDFGSDFKAGYSDLIWTLANSNEFIFIK